MDHTEDSQRREILLQLGLVAQGGEMIIIILMADALHGSKPLRQSRVGRRITSFCQERCAVWLAEEGSFEVKLSI